MSQTESVLNLFTTKMRSMILLFQETKKENLELYAMVDEKEKQIAELEAKIRQMERDYECLKTARMLEVTDGDLEVTKKRVNKLIHDVNKCITLLSEKE